jgi:hypothetical protein
MLKSKLTKLLLLLILADCCFSFYQHYRMPLDGDMSEVIFPKPGSMYYEVLQHPFGICVITENMQYSNPNRFFAHFTQSIYFKYIPLVFQKVISPIESIYLASAIIKLFIQLLIIYILAVFISGKTKLFDNKFLLAAFLVIPLFQTSGYNRYMGIIDKSVTYNFFYSLPLALLMLYFLMFYLPTIKGKEIKPKLWITVLFCLYMVFLSLNGPLNPGVVLILCPILLLTKVQNNFKLITESDVIKSTINAIKKIPRYILFSFIVFCFLSLYSIYIGSYNALNEAQNISVLERYSRIPAGLYYLFTSKIGFTLLFLVIFLNAITIKRNFNTIEGKKIIKHLKILGIFALFYILLLPLGGYRFYRANILRYDTIMPVTIGLFYIYGRSTLFLIEKLRDKTKYAYIFFISVILLAFTNSDRIEKNGYECEKFALITLANSKEKIVKLENNCTVMAWKKFDDYRLSERNAELFKYWNITNEIRYYYQYDPVQK